MRFGKKKVYILDIFGEIAASRSSSFGGGKATDMQEVIKFLHKAEQEGTDKVGGILLRLNTPGGTTGTSEEVAAMIAKVRAKGIPVVASIADVCCSGGYWIASSCDYIFANRTSMTGSIGVIMMLPNYMGLSDKIGVKHTVIKSGGMKDIGNPFRDMTEAERIFLEGHAAEAHLLFINEVVKNRHLDSEADYERLFDGRPFSASFAKDHGMIDAIGTFYDALDYLIGVLGVKDESQIDLKIAIKDKGFFSRMFSAEMFGEILKASTQKLLAGGNSLAMK